MKIILKAMVAIYFVGVVGIFVLHTVSPVTLGLAAARSALWPLWVTTGRPHGEPLPMD